MHHQVEILSVNGLKTALNFLFDINKTPILDSFEEEILYKILKTSSSAFIMSYLENTGHLKGCLSFRITKDGIKRINTLAFEKHKGIGTALVRRLCELTSELPQYSINRPEAIGWVRKLGMSPGEVLADGRQYHHWTSEEVKRFIKNDSNK